MLRGLVVSVILLAAFPAAGAVAADPCRPVTATCVTGADARAAAAAATLASTASNGRVLRGLGLASFSGVAGAAGARAARTKLDGLLAAALSKTLPTRSALRGTPRSPVSATSTTRLAPPGSGLGEVLVVSQRLKRGRVSLLRTLTLQVKVDACPVQRSAGNNHGSAGITIQGSYELLARWTRRGGAVTRGVLITLGPWTGSGLVSSLAAFDGILVQDLAVHVSTSGSSTGPKRYRWSTGVDLVANPSATGWDVKLTAETLDAFVAREEARSRGEEPPGAEAPLASRAAYARYVASFLASVDAAMTRGVAAAQRNWQTPNACAHLEWTPPAGTISMASAEQREVSARIRPVAGGLDGSQPAWPTDPEQLAGTVVQLVTAGSRDGSPVRILQEAGAPVGGLVVDNRWTVPSTVGVAEGDWTAKAIDYPQTIAGTLAGHVYTSGVNISWSGTVTLTFEPNDPFTHTPYWDAVHYQVTGGSIDWAVTGTCSGSGTLTTAEFDGGGFPSAQIDLDPATVDGVQYELLVGVDPGTQMIASCNGGGTVDAAGWVGRGDGALLYNSDIRGPVGGRYSADLAAFAGAYTIVPGNEQRWEWHLTGSGHASFGG